MRGRTTPLRFIVDVGPGTVGSQSHKKLWRIAPQMTAEVVRWKLQASQVFGHQHRLAGAVGDILDLGFAGDTENGSPFRGKQVFEFEPQISPVPSTEDAIVVALGPERVVGRSGGVSGGQ